MTTLMICSHSKTEYLEELATEDLIRVEAAASRHHQKA